MKALVTIEMIVVILLAFEVFLSPRIDRTEEGDILLWCGTFKRSYVFIWRSNKNKEE